MLDKCEHLENEDELFDMLYHLAVGFERLFKVAIVLLEHTPDTDQVEFEKSLITHDHMKLLERLRENGPFELSTPHHALLSCLSRFYQRFRYDRFSLASVTDREKERADFKRFIAAGIGVELGQGESIFVTYDMPRIRRFVGRTVGKITERAFELAKTAAESNHLYTYEIRADSKAYKLFIRKEYDFLKEDIAWKELLIYLLKTKDPSNLTRLISKTAPLDFDSGDAVGYLEAFRSETKKTELVDLVEVLHQERKPLHDRLELLDVIGEQTANLSFEDDELEDEDPR